MKANEIKVGDHYVAKVSNRLVTVRVDQLEKVEGNKYLRGGTRYHVTNLMTGRKTWFRSASKFRFPAKVNPDGTAMTALDVMRARQAQRSEQPLPNNEE